VENPMSTKRTSMENPQASYRRLFEQNRVWARSVIEKDPEFFARLARQQTPEYLWIGCSDSRVPANQIVGLNPGEVFVHRNVANIVAMTDFNALSVIEFAVDQLHVKHILVVGHYGCSGVNAAMNNLKIGIVDNWIASVRDVYDRHHEELSRIEHGGQRLDRLCELNVATQVLNVCRTNIVQDAWKRGQPLSVHGCIYGIADGQLRDLQISVSSFQALEERHRQNLR
jgi:carbonic anhydrase